MAVLYCFPAGTSLCISPEAWAGWAQAFGTVAAILITAWAVQRTHRLQVIAEQKREVRQMAGEVESLEILLGQVLVTFMRADAAAVNARSFGEYLHLSDTATDLREIGQAMDLCRDSRAIKPHLLLQFMRAYNAASTARSNLEFASRADVLFNIDSTKADVMKAVLDLEEIVRGLRATREAYLRPAHQRP